MTEPASSFADFFREEHPRLVALVLGLAGDVELARDVAQEALLRAHGRWADVVALDRPGAWLRRVAINLTWDAHRRKVREARAMQRIGEPDPVLPADPASDGFWREVRSLPERQRAAVALFYVDDLPLAEVVVILDCAEGTVKSLLFKARTRLAERLAAEVV